MRHSRSILASVLTASLCGCVTAMYQPIPGRVPDMSAYDANRACVPVVLEAGREHPAPILPGLLPTIAAGMNTPEGQANMTAVSEAQASCMASHGWISK